MSLPNNVQIVLMQGKTVVLDTVILIAASNFHVFLTGYWHWEDYQGELFTY